MLAIFFRFFMCCKMNFEKLDRIIKDFACSLHPNTLNRALEESKLTRFLVDSAHGQVKND